MCQKGKMTEDVEKRSKESIKWLVKEKRVNGITGDCGFMMNFQSIARQVTKIPTFMSSLCRLPAVTRGYAQKKQMRNLTRDACGVDTQNKRYNIVGCEDVHHFCQAVANGDKVNVEEATPWTVRKAVHVLFKYPKSRAFLLECTELCIIGCHSILHRFASL